MQLNPAEVQKDDAANSSAGSLKEGTTAATVQINLQASPQMASRGSATGNPRNKACLKPGRSLMDWIRLGQSGKDLTGVGGRKAEVTAEELLRHNKRDDAWICLKGRVYNVTSYMEYHPGGEEELLSGVGRDATDAFNKVHQWVNAESMLQKCFVGWLDSSPLTLLAPSSERKNSSVKKNENTGLFRAAPTDSESKVDPNDPSWQWKETQSAVFIDAFVPASKVKEKDVIIQYENATDSFQCRILLPTHTYLLSATLPEKVETNFRVLVKSEFRLSNVEITLNKTEERKWTHLQDFLENTKIKLKVTERNETYYHRCQIRAKYPVTHDTRLFQVELPLGTRMETPIGYHHNLRAQVQGTEISRNYTPVARSLTPDERNSDNFIYFMIKIYPKGALTQQLDGLHVGDVIEISDPIGNFDESRLDECCHLVLLAAGTGFTPMVKLIQWALTQNEQRTVKLMFFNKEERDILWKSALDDLSEKNPRLELCYVLSEAEVDWKGPVGRMRRSLLDPFVSMTPQEVTFCCVCGPTPFTKLCLRILEEEMNFPSCRIHAFQA